MKPANLNAASNEPGLRQWWSVIRTMLVLAVVTEAAFAGAMLSGVGWARMAHAGNAAILIASTLAAGLVSVVMLRGVPHGLKFGLTLLSLAATLFIQAAAGALSTKGAHLMWVHVPLGAALVGLAAHAFAAARRLGAE